MKMFKLLICTYIAIVLSTEITNKYKYFQKSLNDFNEKVNNFKEWEKYYESYSNNTKYLYYKSQNNNEYNIVELIINNEIINNNLNSYYSYSYSHSLFHNMCCSDYSGCYSCNNNHLINKNNIMAIMTNIKYDDKRINQTSYGRHIITNLNKFSNEYEMNKGVRMIKHNLLNNIPNNINSNYNILTIESYYFIEKIYNNN